MKRAIPLFSVFHSRAMEDVAIEVLRSGHIASGQFVDIFRRRFGELVGNPNVVTTADMSSAILISLTLAGVAAGDEVLTTPYTCMSSNAPITWLGATPAWVDVHPKTGLMDPESLERSITPRTKACLLYHVAGYPGPAAEIARICHSAGIALVEDCNNALLATIDGAQVGTFGDYAIHSFYPNRQINATEGGAIVCRHAGDLQRAARLRRFGIDAHKFRDAEGEIDGSCDIAEIGWAASLNNLCSALGAAQLHDVAERMCRTRANASKLAIRLKTIEGVHVVAPGPGCMPAYWALLITVRERRDYVLRELKRAGVAASKLHHRTDSYSGFKSVPKTLPGTERFFETVIALPCGWRLEDEDLETIEAALRSACAVVH